MAKSFYSAKEASAKLGVSADELANLVRSGKIREFRDAGTVHYKAQDVDKLAPADAAGASDSEIILEPADESDIVLAPSSSDVLSLEEAEPTDASEGTRAGGNKDKEGTVVSSVGVSVFDDDELDEVVDPLAQTAISDVADLGLEGAGSGSGILDLTRESDDTSLGAELLDEIYSGEEEATVEMGDDTRAGLDEASGEEPATHDEEAEVVFGAAEQGASAKRSVTITSVECAPDALSAGLTAAMVVATIAMLFGGLAAAAMVQGVLPGVVASVYNSMKYYAGGTVLAAVIAAVVTFLLAKRSG